jgi:hypothetical protein
LNLLYRKYGKQVRPKCLRIRKNIQEKIKEKIVMKERLLNNLTTTLLGLGILVFCGVLMYQEKSTPSELSGWFGLGLMLLRAKDSILGIDKKDDI